MQWFQDLAAQKRFYILFSTVIAEDKTTCVHYIFIKTFVALVMQL